MAWTTRRSTTHSPPASPELELDRDRHRDAQARLERDFLAGAISADEYTRRRRQLHESVSGQESVPEYESLPEHVADDPLSGLRLAGWGRRASALLVDWLLLIAVIVAIAVWTLTTTDPVTDEPGDVQAVVLFLALLFLPSTYQWLMVGTWGQTLGKMALGARVVRGEDAGRVGYARSCGRVASAWVLGVFVFPLLLAYLWPLWDKRNQTLYDKMVNTIVVRVR